MWQQLGRIVLRHRLLLLVVLALATAFMAWHASKVQLGYDFVRAVPRDNPRYVEYMAFRKQFGEDGNLLAIGFQTKRLFQAPVFNDLVALQNELRRVPGVLEVISVVNALDLRKNDSTQQLQAAPIFPDGSLTQQQLDTSAARFQALPFYQGLMYNPQTKAWLVGVRIDRDLLATKGREKVIGEIESLAYAFGKRQQIQMHLSGLPLIRTNVAIKISGEMNWLLIGSLLLSAVILLIFFRSFATMLLSLLVVIIGVVWSVGTLHLFDYKISILTALIPPLIVVIGVPNCIYFLNKYHTSWLARGDKHEALVEMVGKMGIVTLFCNIAAAIGFGVFAFTGSEILREFGVVAGINIMVVFLISFLLLPTALSYLPAPKARHTKYLESWWMSALLMRLQHGVLHRRKLIWVLTGLVIVFSVSGILRLRSEGFIVDDLPKTDRIYSDLKFFEQHFKGVMPLEILIDTKRKNGFAGSRALPIFEKIDTLSRFISQRPDMARPLALTEGLKFARQAFYDGDSANYALPNAFDGAFVSDYLRARRDSAAKQNSLQKLMLAFMDSNRQVTRISVNMADVGSARLPLILDTVQQEVNRLFDSTKFSVRFTGSTVTFLEGSRFIINGLKESIAWAFVLISLCMLYLFRSLRILLCSLIPNIIPLMLTAGIMGWVGIPLKPSTVLVFSVALGIAIDVTIRFLVNYKQELPLYGHDVRETVVQTIRHTGISIIYTSLVLIAGFVIFIFSGFGGTKALGWLTSLTLLSATITNLVLLPILLLAFAKKKN